MNYIPIDISCVETLFSQGRPMFDRIHPVKDLETAKACALKGHLFMKCSVTEKELQECFKLHQEIQQLTEKRDAILQKVVDDAQLALADRPFHTFALETPTGQSIRVGCRNHVVVGSDAMEDLYNRLGKDEGPIERQIVYKLSDTFKQAVLPFVVDEVLDQPTLEIAEEIINRHKLDETPEHFIKVIGKTHGTRISRMQKLYGFNRADANDYSVMLHMSENWNQFKEFYHLVENLISFDDFKSLLLDKVKATHSINLRIVSDSLNK